MEVKKYLQIKEKGLVALTKFGKDVIMTVRRFDPDTGEETEPEQMRIVISEWEKMVQAKEAELASLKQLVTDCKALK